MKQSDILSFAINGVYKDLVEAQKRVTELQDVLNELRESDKQEPEPAVGRPAGFVAEPFLKSDKL